MYKIRPVVSHTLQVTKTKSIQVFAISDYQDPIKKLILAKSWSSRIASHQLGQLIWQQTGFNNLVCDFLVPVPLHWTRYAWRGFNQAAEIANVLKQKSGVPVADILRREKRTLLQASLPVEQRATNVHNVFALKVNSPELYRNKHLIIVDDVMTTGATLSQLARQLFILHPASIRAIVAARVV